MAERIHDVAVIGYGPVGMATAALLGRYGHDVVVLERYSGKYNLPRAAIFDDETMRTFALLGIAERLLPTLHVQRNYEWVNGAGELLIEHAFAATGASGWAEWYMMYQPHLEDALDAVCQAAPSVSVHFDSRVVGIDQGPESVRLSVDGAPDVHARFVIACDGGNSFVRSALEVPLSDYGFSEPWLVCDFRLRRRVDVPTARQVCDPVQPTSIISLGPDHHRFSFMLESADAFERERDPERVWARVAKYLGPDDAELIRAATYTFRSLVATRWRAGRVLLAGDAAHQMPPFLGQGMCSGVRDALNLAFKLDLILTGGCGPDLLDTYQSERDGHVRAVVTKGIELGRVQTMRDPVAAAERDARMLAARAESAAPDKMVFPPLGPGLFGAGPGSRHLFVQGRVEAGGRTGRFDEVLGHGWAVLARSADQDGFEVTLVADPGGERPGPTRFADLDGCYRAWLDAHGADAVAIRPDFHVWGSAAGQDAADRLWPRLGLLDPVGTRLHEEIVGAG